MEKIQAKHWIKEKNSQSFRNREKKNFSLLKKTCIGFDFLYKSIIYNYNKNISLTYSTVEFVNFKSFWKLKTFFKSFSRDVNQKFIFKYFGFFKVFIIFDLLLNFPTIIDTKEKYRNISLFWVNLRKVLQLINKTVLNQSFICWKSRWIMSSKVQKFVRKKLKVTYLWFLSILILSLDYKSHRNKTLI